ncbi:MAG: MarR family transcriptional regulator [Bacteroidota bacterium]
MEFISPNKIVIYSIELAIKSYRKFAQKNIQRTVDDITLDQALLLILLQKDPSLNQMQLSKILFKDYAATTRIIDLLVKNGYLSRTVHQKDGRRKALSISPKGTETIKTVKPIIANNRKTALDGLSKEEIETLDRLLKKIVSNCN